jgi:hypothetical protein
MLSIFCEGPKEQFQAELDSVNRHGLIYLIGRLTMLLGFVKWAMPGYDFLFEVRNAKRLGKHLAAIERRNKFELDPDGEVDKILRRRAAAKKAARRRKRTSR